MLVDDHALFREGMASLLSAHDFMVVGMAGDGFEALEIVRQVKPDVILMDIYMPKCDGLLATRLIKAEMPQIIIVMLTASEEDEKLLEAIKIGACGYLFKKLQPKDLLELFSSIKQGESPLTPGMMQKVLMDFHGESELSEASAKPQARSELTPRQEAILSLVASGQTYRQVGETLRFSERTIKHEIKQILETLQLKNRSQAIAYAVSQGLTDPQTE